MHLSFRRIQFTPDLMPADITGTDIIQEDAHTGRREFVFHEGPDLRADDPGGRNQPHAAQDAGRAARSDAGARRSPSAAYATSSTEPFFVLATQNPIEQEGTYPLPEAQQDRFMFLVKVDYPDREQERQIVARTTGTFGRDPAGHLTARRSMQLQKVVRKVPVPDHVMDFVLDLVRFTRPNNPDAPAFVKDLIDWGAGPRACQNLVLAARCAPSCRAAST